MAVAQNEKINVWDKNLLIFSREWNMRTMISLNILAMDDFKSRAPIVIPLGSHLYVPLNLSIRLLFNMVSFKSIPSSHNLPCWAPKNTGFLEIPLPPLDVDRERVEPGQVNQGMTHQIKMIAGHWDMILPFRSDTRSDMPNDLKWASCKKHVLW